MERESVSMTFLHAIHMNYTNEMFFFFIYRKIHHIQKERSVLKSIFQLNIHLNRQKFASKPKFIIQISMKRVKFVCQLLAQKIGNQPPKRIKVMGPLIHGILIAK